MFPLPEELPPMNDLCEYCRYHPGHCGTTRSECEMLLENGGESEAKFRLRGDL